jgi:hypothetical protein
VLFDAPPGALLSLTPIYDFLKARGAFEREEHLVVHGVLTQILPAHDALTEEAVREAVEHRFGGTKAKVMRVEHLLAIALKTGRAKDHARIALLLEEVEVDAGRLAGILERHGLLARWQRFKQEQP